MTTAKSRKMKYVLTIGGGLKGRGKETSKSPPLTHR